MTVKLDEEQVLAQFFHWYVHKLKKPMPTTPKETADSFLMLDGFRGALELVFAEAKPALDAMKP